jgi:hypothetical protein
VIVIETQIVIATAIATGIEIGIATQRQISEPSRCACSRVTQSS